MEKMYCYLWHEKTDVDECKFGERWVKEGQDPKKEILPTFKLDMICFYKKSYFIVRYHTYLFKV